jgi:hypothetical protein
MKGISATLIIIVTAIVILIAALVVLTIFGSGITPIVDLTAQKNICLQQAGVTCQTTKQMPPTWNAQVQYTKDGKIEQGSCASITGCSGCDGCFGIYAGAN